MTDGDDGARRPGRPRSQEVDSAVLDAALEILLERGAAEASIEKIAQRAGVTRATVYRRFPDKVALLVRAIEAVQGSVVAEGEDADEPAWPTVGQMLGQWAGYLAVPRNRRLLRRLYAAVDDYPDLMAAYLRAHGRQRANAVRSALGTAAADGSLPAGTDLDLLAQVLSGAVLLHLSAHPDSVGVEEIESYLTGVMTLAGYAPSSTDGDAR